MVVCVLIENKYVVVKELMFLKYGFRLVVFMLFKLLWSFEIS